MLAVCLALLSTQPVHTLAPPLTDIRRGQRGNGPCISQLGVRLRVMPLSAALTDAESSDNDRVRSSLEPIRPQTFQRGIPTWLLLVMVFAHVLANSLLSQAVPTAMLSAVHNDRIRAAHQLGRLAACGGKSPTSGLSHARGADGRWLWLKLGVTHSERSGSQLCSTF